MMPLEASCTNRDNFFGELRWNNLEIWVPLTILKQFYSMVPSVKQHAAYNNPVRIGKRVTKFYTWHVLRTKVCTRNVKTTKTFTRSVNLERPLPGSSQWFATICKIWAKVQEKSQRLFASLSCTHAFCLVSLLCVVSFEALTLFWDVTQRSPKVLWGG